jgi:hypothetical protein
MKLKMLFKTIRNKILFSRVIKEFKIGWDLVKLPNHIVILESRISFRILKFIGAVCLFLMMSGIAKQFHLLIIFYIYTYSFLYSVYRLYLCLYTIYQFILVVVNGKFIARNSPVNGIYTFLRLISITIQTTASFTVGTGITFALCHELDDILVSEGKEPYFVPGMKSIIVKSGLEGTVKNTLKRFGFKDSEPRSINEILLKMTPEERLKYQEQTGQSWESLYNGQKSLQEYLINPTENKKILHKKL